MIGKPTNDNFNPSPLHRAFRWMFADRETGRIVIAQWPNLPLWLFIAAWLAGLIFHPSGLAASIIAIVGAISLTVWALDEIVRGVCPWRRFLGGAVLAMEILGWVRMAMG